MRVRPRTAARSLAIGLCLPFLAGTSPRADETATPRPAGPSIEYSKPRKLGVIDDPRLPEASGILAVRGMTRTYWVHNDSGDAPRVLAIRQDGTVLLEARVPRAAATDWEDIARGPGPARPEGGRPPCLFLGDIGNNARDRRILVVWRFEEPDVAAALAAASQKGIKAGSLRIETEPAVALRFKYPGSPCDAEALVADPETGRLYVLTKQLLGSKVYRLEGSAPGIESSVQVAEPVADLAAGLVTAADVATDGRRLVVRTYLEVKLHVRPEGKPFEALFDAPPIELPRSWLEVQGEAVCFDADGSVVTVSESNPKLIHRISPQPPPGAPKEDAKKKTE